MTSMSSDARIVDGVQTPNTYEDSPSQETKISSTLKKRTHAKSATKKHGRRSRFPS